MPFHLFFFPWLFRYSRIPFFLRSGKLAHLYFLICFVDFELDMRTLIFIVSFPFLLRALGINRCLQLASDYPLALSSFRLVPPSSNRWFLGRCSSFGSPFHSLFVNLIFLPCPSVFEGSHCSAFVDLVLHFPAFADSILLPYILI